MAKGNILAIYVQKMNIGVALFDFKQVRIQCSQLLDNYYFSFDILRQLISRCTTLVSNNFLHQLFYTVDLEQYEVHKISQTILQEETIIHSLTKIASHHPQPIKMSPLFYKFSKNRYKFNSLGMLLSYLDSCQNMRIFIQDVEFLIDTLLLRVGMGISELEFLEISKEDFHPSLVKAKNHHKEGYSLISAYQSYLHSSGSKKVLRHFLMNPTFNHKTHLQRHQVIRWMKKYLRDNKYIKIFRNMHSMESIIPRFNRMNVQQQQWRKIIKNLQTLLELRAILNHEDKPSIIQQYVQDQAWNEMIDILNVFKSTIELQPLGIRHGVDETLDEKKKIYDQMPHILTLIGRDQQWPFKFRIVFMSQIGYLIRVDPQQQIPDNGQFEEWFLQFINNSGTFYSNNLTEWLDEKYGDVFGQIQDIQKKIIFDLESLIIERENLLLKLYWKFSQIQCFWGISQLSKNMCQPVFSSEGLIISNGWHLLLSGNIIHNHSFSFPQKQAPRESVYNSEHNLVNTNYSNRCSIITGPNSSGKTVYIKQVGLIIYLAHCGLYVPATLAEIPMIDNIYFVGKGKSIYNQQRSGFKEQLASLSLVAMKNSISNKSLVLIDQIGSEIDYQNSLRLFCTTINYMTSSSSPFLSNRLLSSTEDEFVTPLIFVVTHLSEILKSQVLEQSYLIRFLTMQVEQEGLRLFKIRPGLVKKGYGIRKAAQILPRNVIEISSHILKVIHHL